MLKSKTITCTVVLIVLSVLLTGCRHATASARSSDNARRENATRLDAQSTEPEGAQITASDGKITLTLGGIALEGSVVQSIVNDFNASSDSCQVVLEDYLTSADSLSQAVTVMQTTLLAGSAPDMLCFTGVSPLKWLAAGLLLDMDTLVQADTDIQTEDILIWDALHEYDGLYLLSPTFYVDALSCSAETLQAHAGWTIDEYLQVEQQLRDGQDLLYGMTATEFLRNMGGRYLRTAMDLKNAACDLTTPAFCSILNGSVQAGEYEASYDPNRNVPQRIIAGDLICCYVQLTSGAEVAFDRYRCGQTLSYIGWPTPDGSCGYDITLPMPVGVCADTKNPDACWSFMKYLLQHPYLTDSASGTPTYAPLLEKQRQVLNELGSPFETTADDIAIVAELAKKCQTLSFYDENALQIIFEEAEIMRQEGFTAKETAERIQSRVSLYMAEQYG